MNQPVVGWVSDSVTQQIQEQSSNYSGGTDMSGYATLTRPTMLPEGWCLTKLSEVAEWGSGGTPSRKNPSFYGGNIPWVKTGDLGPRILNEANEFITEEAVANSSAKFFPKGSVAIAMYGATIGKTSILGIDSTTNQACGVGQPLDRLTTTAFLYYFLLNEKDNFIAKGKGGAQPNISQAIIKEHEVALPPLAEQQQIDAKLDELLAQVDILKTRLNTIPKILKRFRQSVLVAAMSGKLTEDWRGDAKYTKTEFGLSIPHKWHLLVIDDIAEVKGGKRLPKGEILVSENTGYPYIRAGQLKNGTVIEDDQLFLLKHVQAKISKYIVSTGDIYITIVGACIGDTGIIPSNYDGANLTENAAKLCLFKKPLQDQFLSNWLRCQYLQGIIQHEIKSGAQGKLALKRIKTLPFPYPTIEEQTEIVNRVEQLFAYADQIEQRVKDAQARVNHLTQSILAKAFRGELTADWRAQNPDLISGENSAEALLIRIKAEREMTKPVKQAQRLKAK